jgi:hypothetical protein
MAPAAMAQQATANVNGVVKDPSGASVANAQVALTNVDTGVVRRTTSNTDGIYDFPSVVPGVYSMQASAAGFAAVAQPAVTLQVGQTATFDFHLTVGATTSTVEVTAAAPSLEFSTSELGTVVSPAQVNDLPLNGRNFTELLTMLPGVSNINTDQNSGGGGGWNGASIGQFSFPAVNGARNRSNMFILDGSNDLNTLSGTYNYSPIIDAIQEFKSQGHNDLAEYGGAAGATVSVVTKGGTNEYHGDAWEFLRNQVMDSTGYFNRALAPLRQNQFGASFGGPVSIPKLYNGKNRTFFFVAWEDFTQRTANESPALGPTAAMRSGDFSALCLTGFTAGVCNDTNSSGQTIDQLYDPASTVASGSGFTRTPFLNNQIPSGRISPISTLYESIIPLSGALVHGSNLFFPQKSAQDQQSGTLRVDQNFGNNNQVMFRYSQFDLFTTSPSGTIGNAFIHVPGHNYIGHWTHTYSSTAFSDVYFSRNYGYTYTGTSHAGEDAAFLSQLKTLGMSPYFMTLDNTTYAPQYTANGYVGLSGSQLQASGLADDWEFGGSFTKILGRHTIKAGADFVTNNFTSPIAYSNIGFSNVQTSSEGANPGLGGNSWASLLLGVPDAAGYRNIDEVVTDGWINGIYVQDQFKATSRLTLNLGFRNDMVYPPIYGTGNAGNYYTGEANPLTGQYVLNALPPNCSATQGAPCIPTGIYTASATPAPGGLPAHAVVSSNLRMIKNSLADWAPRVGVAFRLNDKTVIRAAYSRFYDEWADITQLAQAFGGNWPAVATVQNNGLNLNIPTAGATDPLQLGSGGAIVYPINDFSQVSQWMVDPNFQTPVFDQWNAGIQRQLPGNMTLDANYVGSNGRHEDYSAVLNVPQPGPGNVQTRRPYPYMLEQWFDQTVGDSRYSALQVTVTERPTHGINFLAAYTLSQSNADGCNLGSSCDSTNPYNRKGDYGNSDLNERNVFSVAFTAASPYDKSPNKLVSIVAGGWALNGIVQVTSGQPYTVSTGTDAENVGCCNQERANEVSNPNSSVPKNSTEIQWINPSSFVQPAAYTYGTEKVNPLASQHWNDVDMSLFRKFNLGLGEQRYFEFRAESFNLFNNVVFGVPNTSLNSPVDSAGNPTFGTITSQRNPPRILQMSLKLYY